MGVEDVHAYKEMETECKIHLISSAEACAKIMEELKFGDMIGLDCEWRSELCKGEKLTEGKLVKDGEGKEERKKGKVALLQLATAKDILLIHLHSIGFIPPSLQKILTSHDIIKVGAAINIDKRKLRKDYGVDVASVRNIDPMTKGLAKLVRWHLRVELPKVKRVRCSNWELWPLTKEQVLYAAADAYYSLRVATFPSATPFDESEDKTVEGKEEKKGKKGKPPSTTQNKGIISNVKLHTIRVYSFDGTYTHIAPERILHLMTKGIIVRSDPCMIHPAWLPEFIREDGTRADCYYHRNFTNILTYPILELPNCCVVCGGKEDFHRLPIVGSIYHKMLTDTFGKTINEKLLLNSSFNRLLFCGHCSSSWQSYTCTYLKSLQQSFCDQKNTDYLTGVLGAAKKYNSKAKFKKETEGRSRRQQEDHRRLHQQKQSVDLGVRWSFQQSTKRNIL